MLSKQQRDLPLAFYPDTPAPTGDLRPNSSSTSCACRSKLPSL